MSGDFWASSILFLHDTPKLDVMRLLAVLLQLHYSDNPLAKFDDEGLLGYDPQKILLYFHPIFGVLKTASLGSTSIFWYSTGYTCN